MRSSSANRIEMKNKLPAAAEGGRNVKAPDQVTQEKCSSAVAVDSVDKSDNGAVFPTWVNHARASDASLVELRRPSEVLSFSTRSVHMEDMPDLPELKISEVCFDAAGALNDNKRPPLSSFPPSLQLGAIATDARSFTVGGQSKVDQAGTNDKASASGKKKKFPEILMDILSDPVNSDVITWSPMGTYFVIRCPFALTEHVLPRYFHRANKYCSFTRKLHRYGFKKTMPMDRAAVVVPTQDIFMHDKFRRGDIELCREICVVAPSSVTAPAVTTTAASRCGSHAGELEQRRGSPSLLISRRELPVESSYCRRPQPQSFPPASARVMTMTIASPKKLVLSKGNAVGASSVSSDICPFLHREAKAPVGAPPILPPLRAAKSIVDNVPILHHQVTHETQRQQLAVSLADVQRRMDPPPTFIDADSPLAFRRGGNGFIPPSAAALLAYSSAISSHLRRREQQRRQFTHEINPVSAEELALARYQNSALHECDRHDDLLLPFTNDSTSLQLATSITEPRMANKILSIISYPSPSSPALTSQRLVPSTLQAPLMATPPSLARSDSRTLANTAIAEYVAAASRSKVAAAQLEESKLEWLREMRLL